MALNTLVHLLRKLGFMINWSKVVDPTTSITFLGIEIDSSTMELRLPADKLSLLRLELNDFKVRKRASKKQLVPCWEAKLGISSDSGRESIPP